MDVGRSGLVTRGESGDPACLFVFICECCFTVLGISGRPPTRSCADGAFRRGTCAIGIAHGHKQPCAAVLDAPVQRRRYHKRGDGLYTVSQCMQRWLG